MPVLTVNDISKLKSACDRAKAAAVKARDKEAAAKQLADIKQRAVKQFEDSLNRAVVLFASGKNLTNAEMLSLGFEAEEVPQPVAAT